MAYAFTYKPLTFTLLRSGGVTYYGKTDRFQIRGHSTPKDPKTTDQLNSRSFLGVAKREWMKLSAEEKALWKEFAQKNLTLNKKEYFVKWRGIDAFCRASISLQTAGLGARPELPRGRRPEMLEAIELLPGNDRRELAFKIWHEVQSLDGHALLVRLTPTGKSPACRPYKTNLRHVRGVGPESVIAMPLSGEVVRVPNVRVDLEPGYLYAVEIRVMRLSDGAVGDPFYQIAERAEVAPVEMVMSNGDVEVGAAARGETTSPVKQTDEEEVKTKSVDEKGVAGEVSGEGGGVSQAAISDGGEDGGGGAEVPVRRTSPKLTPAERYALKSKMPKFRGSKWFPSARVNVPGWSGRFVE